MKVAHAYPHRTNIKDYTVIESSAVLTSWVPTTTFMLLMAGNEEVPKRGNSSSIPFKQMFMEHDQLMYVIGLAVPKKMVWFLRHTNNYTSKNYEYLQYHSK
jgi:hypothetical protein